jgi:hypothetical protein
VVDINLGAGPSFRFADRLTDQRIPFVLVTGCDQGVIPDEFANVARRCVAGASRHSTNSSFALIDASPTARRLLFYRLMTHAGQTEPVTYDDIVSDHANEERVLEGS